jgi:threonyl-tRNA synthetase
VIDDPERGRAAHDHRDLNADMSIFASEPMIGAGLPLWLPAGAAIRHELELLARQIAQHDGCVPVYSPVLGKRALYERSGHWQKFREDMFPSMRVGGDELVLRPANCPHHAMIYAAERHSYRQLPIRLNELGSMFRAERSGVISGLSRVRQISLDDTHVFCRPDQVGAEITRALRSALEAQRVLGLPVDYVRLSRGGAGDGFLGSAEQWHHAEEALRSAAAEVLGDDDPPLVEAIGEAAFYGPKLDLQVRDRRGHEETIATVQLDFNQPERFDLSYDAADGTRQRAVMIHRGTVGAMERVVAALLERYSGRLPLWLAPVQVCVLPVGPAQDAYARALVDDLCAAGLRPRLDMDGSLGARIRHSRERRDALIAVVGPDEAASDAVHVTDPAADFSGRVAREGFLASVADARNSRAARAAWPAEPG